MPDIASFHPQVVHFVVALGIVGVLLRLVGLTGRLPWTSPAAAAALLVAAGASVVAVESGHQAHGVAERIPGVRQAVQEHEELGESTRNAFLAVAALELAAIALARRGKLGFWLRIGSGAAGLVACGILYEAAEHGGGLVYSYAGGIGTRSGDTADVRRLLVAGLYHEAQLMRRNGKGEEAARLTDELVRQVPADPAVSLLAIESRLRDRHDPQGALAALDGLAIPSDDPRLTVQTGLLRSEALLAVGRTDSARAVLSTLARQFPENRRIREAIANLH